MSQSSLLRVALAQMAPVWLQREATLEKIHERIVAAANDGCQFVAFGEAIVPGYPFWLERTDGARFDSPQQKRIFAHYAEQAVQIEADHLTTVCTLAREHQMHVMLGCIERPADRGGHSLYCSLVMIDDTGQVASIHRKLVPTYEERLAWSPGDGHGLRVHSVGPFTVGGLNCWENWMPLARAALYALGENLHVAVWPGSQRNTVDITRFIAQESRSYVLSVSGLMSAAGMPADAQQLTEISADDQNNIWADGGSCIAAPDGSWVIAPVTEQEQLIIAELDFRRVQEERQNFDAAGHYGRPDVTELRVDRRRQATAVFEDV